MNVLQTLTTFYNALPLDSTYRTVAQGILRHLPKIPDMTIYEIADLTASSRTTIWRMTQKMGYRSFSEFHYELSQAVAQYDYYNRSIPSEKATSEQDIIHAVTDQLHEAASVVSNATDNTSLVSKIVQLLHDADKIAFYLQMQAATFSNLQINLSMTGKDTSFFSLHSDIREDAKTLTEHSVAFVTTLDRVEVKNLDGVLDELHQRGCTVIMGSGYNSRHRQYVDYFLFPQSKNQSGIRPAFEALIQVISEEYRRKYL